MSDDSSRNPSSRVFHVDRECYVVYVGTSDHRFRPFLRLGTSPWLPEKVKRHVSNVVISDHLTGNPQYERQCLEHPVSHDMRYVGTKELVNSVKQFVHDQTIASRPISPPKDEEAERQGAHVLFYSDGNVRVVVDGKEVLDLSKRERSDRHGVFELRRLNDFASSSTGAYFASSFTQPGFLYNPEGSLYFFREESFEVRRLASHGLDTLARRLVPLELIRRMSGPVERESFIDICKWKLREKQDLSVAVPESGADEIEELLTLLSKAGLHVTREDPTELPEPLSAVTAALNPKEAELTLQDSPEAPRELTLGLPAGASWLGGAGATILPGMPYYLAGRTKARLEAPERATLLALCSDELRKKLELPEDRPVTPAEVGRFKKLLTEASSGTAEEPVPERLLGNLLLWNLITEALWNEGEGSEELSKELSALAPAIGDSWRELLDSLPLPVTAAIHGKGDTFAVTFSLPPGFTKGRISENRRVYQKILAFLDRRQERGYYQEERRRLESFLDSLIERQRVAPVSAPEVAKAEAARAKAERETGASARDAERRRTERTGSERQGAGTAGTAKSGSAAPRPGRPQTGSGAAAGGGSGKEGGPSRKGLLIAAVAILLLGGAGYLLFLGLGGAEEEIAAEPDDAVIETEETENGDGETTEADRDPAGDPAREDDATDQSEEVVAVGNGGFEVTVVDILVFVNRVARLNGYDPIGSVSPDGRDPDWIFPGNRIELPDDTTHVVERGDTLWGISREFLLAHVNEHFAQFQQLKAQAESGDPPIERIENLREEVYVESLREAITDFLESL
ncbi:MAG: hypothetical protein ACLFPP_13430 [Spirochaetaceae bacterium]